MRYIIVILIVLFSFGAQAQSAVSTSDNPVISIYPNPTTSHFTVNHNENISKLEIFNIIGSHILTFNDVESNARHDVSSLSNGLYLVRITNDSGNVIATKRLNKK